MRVLLALAACNEFSLVTSTPQTGADPTTGGYDPTVVDTTATSTGDTGASDRFCAGPTAGFDWVAIHRGAWLSTQSSVSNLERAPDGSIHLLVSDLEAGGLLHMHLAPGGTWVTDEIFDTTAPYRDPDLVFDTAGAMHAVVRRDDTQEVLYVTDAAGAWSTEVVADPEILGWSNAIAVDETGVVHALFHERKPTVGDEIPGILHYAQRDLAGGWSTRIVDPLANAGRYNDLTLDGTTPTAWYYRTSWSSSPPPLDVFGAEPGTPPIQIDTTDRTAYPVSGCGHQLTATRFGEGVVLAYGASASGQLSDPERPNGHRIAIVDPGGTVTVEILDQPGGAGDIAVVEDPSTGELHAIYGAMDALPVPELRHAVRTAPDTWAVETLADDAAWGGSQTSAVLADGGLHVAYLGFDERTVMYGLRCL